MSFEMSPNGIEKLAEALCKAQKALAPAAKDKQAHNYMYADLNECWDVARAPLADNGLAIFQAPSVIGKAVTTETLLMHISGQWLKSTLTLEADNAKIQTIGSAITYGRRYSFSSAVGITSAKEIDDDDGKKANGSDDGKKANGSSSKNKEEEKKTSPKMPFDYEKHWPAVLKHCAMKGDESYADLLKEFLTGKEFSREIVEKMLHDAKNGDLSRQYQEQERLAMEG